MSSRALAADRGTAVDGRRRGLVETALEEGAVAPEA
jgi:hypothetical protein